MKKEFLDQIDELKKEAADTLSSVSDIKEVNEIKINYLGRKGKVTALLKGLSSLDKKDRPTVGKEVNQLKNFIEERCSEMFDEMEKRAGEIKIKSEKIDVTLPPPYIDVGKIHPITKTMNDLVEVFARLGFSVFEGPEVETDYNNFEALNMPKDHPARDMQDTFYLENELLLRTHTSPVQVRVMKKKKPPIYMVSPGVVYRRDTPDLTHSPVFHQLEGLMVDEYISFADLKGVLTEFVHSYFGVKTKVRFRPSFFPFTEPSAEMEIQCSICQGKGCRFCKNSGWLEVLGCGMVDPAVFESVDYGSAAYTGFAFGMGVDRIALLKYNIDDIRLFYENDKRFLDQF